MKPKAWCAQAVVIAAMLATLWHAFPSIAVAQRTQWLTGEALQRQLALPVSIEWEGRPLREGLSRLADSIAPPARLAYMLDRRVDPSRPLSLKIAQVPLREALEQVAAALDLEVAMLGALVYIGPPPAARRLRTLAALRKAEANELPPASRQTMLAETAWNIELLSVPRELLKQSAEKAGIIVTNLEAIPHDLWPAIALPPLSLVDRWTLVLNQFDLTFRIAPGGERIALGAIEPPVTLARRYPMRQGEAQLRNAIEGAAPNATVERASGGLVVRGRVEDHEQIAAALDGTVESPRPNSSTLETRYTMTVRNESLARVMESLRQRLEVNFEIDSEALQRANISTEQLVKLEVRQVTLDELLTALFKPVGLAFRRDGRTVHVQPAK
ncbi:MAG: hypothetical protein WDZ59_11250 [Pirellulales bacterium]